VVHGGMTLISWKHIPSLFSEVQLVSIESFLYNRDESKFKVIAGDISEGFWEIEGSSLRKVPMAGTEARELVNLEKNLKKVDVKDALQKDPFEPLVGAALGALLGLRFGPLGIAGGAATGLFLLRHGPEISVNCELNDGRKFIAVMSPPMHERLRAFLGERHKEFVL
jgi:hypothetical protein